MSTRPSPASSRLPTRNSVFLIGLLLSAGILSAVALLVPLPTAPEAIPLSLGEVSPQDILAPREIHYQSTVLTDMQKDIAANAVMPEYAPPDASVARNQASDLRAVLTYISSVRADEYATLDQKISDLTALENIQLTAESMDEILSMSDSDWDIVHSEAIDVLEQVMRTAIREDQIENTRSSIPALVSTFLTEDQAILVTELVTAFVTPNSYYSETLTEEKRQAARVAVEPVMKSFKANQIVVNRGSVITEVDIEALEQLGLRKQEIDWKERTSVITLVVANFTMVSLYFAQRPDLRSDNRSMLLLTFLFILFLYGARLVVPNRTVIPYLFPIAGFGMIVTSLVSSRAAMILTVPLSILAGYGLSHSLELILFYLFSSMFGVLVLRNIQRILTFFIIRDI